MLCPGLRLSHLAIFFLTMRVSPEASYGPTVISCWKNWLKMNDANYLRALERYDSCGKLMSELTNEMRERYKKSLVENLQRSSNYFFDHTEMSPAKVIRVLRSANRLMESWTRGKGSFEMGPRGKASDEEEPLPDYPRGNGPFEQAPRGNGPFEAFPRGKGKNQCNNAPDLCPPCQPLSPCNEEEEDEDSEPCSDKAMLLFWWTRFLFLSFIALIVVQSLLLLILFCKVCCTDLLTHFPSCAYETQCCCEEDKEWITKLINECEAHLANQQECYPFLLDGPSRKMKSSTAIGYGTNIGKRGNRDDEILTDLTPLSSPRIGSDSEFEALMNRRPLKKH